MRGRTFLLVLCGLALILRAVAVGRDDLWSDEVHTLLALGQSPLELVKERLTAGHLPLYFLLMKGWTSLFGTTAVSIRLPSVLFGVALVWPGFYLFRHLAGLEAARWGAALLAVHPLLVELSREARMYPLLLLLALIAAESALRALSEGRIPYRFWPAVVLGPFVHPTWGLAVLPLVLIVLPAARSAGSRCKVARVLGAALVLSLGLLVLGIASARVPGVDLDRRPWPREVTVFVLRLIAGEGVRDRLLPFYGLLAVGWAVALAAGFRSASDPARRFALLFALVPPAACVLAGLLLGSVTGPVRYVAVVAVPLALLAGIGMDRWPVGRLLLVLVLAGLALRFVPARTPWSDAAREIEAVATEGDAVVVPDEASRIVLSHYLRRPVRIGSPPEGTMRWFRAELVDDRVRVIRVR